MEHVLCIMLQYILLIALKNHFKYIALGKHEGTILSIHGKMYIKGW